MSLEIKGNMDMKCVVCVSVSLALPYFALILKIKK